MDRPAIAATGGRGEARVFEKNIERGKGEASWNGDPKIKIRLREWNDGQEKNKNIN